MTVQEQLARRWAKLAEERQGMLELMERTEDDIRRIEDELKSLYDDLSDWGRARAYELAND